MERGADTGVGRGTYYEMLRISAVRWLGAGVIFARDNCDYL